MAAGGGVIDDRTTTRPKDGRDFVLHGEQHAADVDVAYLMVLLDLLLGCQQAELALDASVIERDVQPAEGCDGLFDEGDDSSSRMTSVCTNKPRPPVEVISRATCSPSATRRPETTTFAPSLAKASAVALPMPEVPPVIRTVFFSKVGILALWLVSLLRPLLYPAARAKGRPVQAAD
jgi:hypothetical protein